MQGLDAMDTTPIPLQVLTPQDPMDPSALPPLSENIMPSFLPPIPPPLSSFAIPNVPLQHDPGMFYHSEADPSELQANVAPMLLPIADVSVTSFLNAPMEITPVPPMPLPSYLPNIRTVLNTYQVASSPEQLDYSPGTRNHSASPPSSHIPSPPSNKSSPSYSSGASPLNGAVEGTTLPGGRSRANTSISPPSILSQVSSPPLNVQLGELSSRPRRQPKGLVKQMLHE